MAAGCVKGLFTGAVLPGIKPRQQPSTRRMDPTEEDRTSAFAPGENVDLSVMEKEALVRRPHH